MDDTVIRAEGLGKKYVIGHQSQPNQYDTFRDMLARSASSFVQSLRDLREGRPQMVGDEREEFWALQNVSFDVQRGDILGILGRNGAGKSTLLKILSRITEPSAGRVEIRGRVASLLEVGTGFHPELTGRENIYLNGTILGMTRREIRRKFDEIVAFAGVERFLDTPVKRYSSGMYVRLAFAVAAHLEPEILVVDEVLAVGDSEFQKKCLGRMETVSGEGRTILFVSHNLPAAQRLCRRGMLLEKGRTIFIGDIDACVHHYINKIKGGSDRDLDLKTHPRQRQPDRRISLSRVSCQQEPVFEMGPFTVRLGVTVAEPIDDVNFAIGFSDPYGRRIFTTYSNGSHGKPSGSFNFDEEGEYEIEIHYQNLPLAPAMYHMDSGIFLIGPRILDETNETLQIEVQPTANSAISGYQSALVDAQWRRR